LSTWLHYHRSAAGVCKFYVRVEDTPELAILFETVPWDDVVVASFRTGMPSRDNRLLGSRQADFMREAIIAARDDGLTHLLHIDDDELLYLPHGLAALHAALRNQWHMNAASLHARTLEALVPSIHCADAFAEAVCFRHRPWEYGSYGYPPSSGKSFGVLRCDDLCPNGPHHWGLSSATGTGDIGGEPLGEGRSATLPHGVAVILHYESSTLSRWRDKFGELVTRDEAAAKAAKFSPFYAESVRAAQRLRDADPEPRQQEAEELTHAQQPSSATSSLSARSRAEVHAQHVWQRWREAPRSVPNKPAAGEAWRVYRHHGLTLLAQPVASTPPMWQHGEALKRRFEYWSALCAAVSAGHST